MPPARGLMGLGARGKKLRQDQSILLPRLSRMSKLEGAWKIPKGVEEMETLRQKWAVACPSPKGRRKDRTSVKGHKAGPVWPGVWEGLGVRLGLPRLATPVPSSTCGTSGSGPRTRAQVARGRGWGRAPLQCTLTPPSAGPMLTAWSRSVSSRRRFLHLAAANLLRSRRTLLFSSSSGVS